jgi:phage-related protein
MENKKKLKAVFFKSSSGKEPVREWLLGLSKEQKKLIGGDIKTVEYGWPIGMPVCRPMGNGLFEVRTELENTISRVLFSISDGQMLLLHGFIKKTKATPNNELDIAKRRLKEARL